ncbi:hypothetical protein Q7P37_008738 [Cladosporium fusiforme]
MFFKSFAAFALLGNLTGQLMSTAADKLPELSSYGFMRPNPRSIPVSRQLGEVPAPSVDQHGSHVWKRAASNDSDLALQQQESWYWGGDVRSANDSRDAIANLTAIAFDAERYLTQERFGNTISSVGCANGTIKFTFKNQDGFDAARNSWNWVNNGERRIIIILSSGTCNSTARQPYLAKRVSFQDLTAIVEAHTSSWSDAISQGKFQLNTQGLASSNNTLKKRLSVQRTQSIAVGSSFSGSTLFSRPINDTDLTASIECSDCGTRGSLDLDINVDFTAGLPKFFGGGWTGQKLWLRADYPIWIWHADARMKFKVGGTISEELSATISLPEIPLAGVHVPGVLDISPVIRILGEASLSQISAEATLSIGARLDVPSDAIAKVDFSDSSKNQFSGWVPTFTPVGPELSGSVSISASVGPRINLELDLSILGGKLGLGTGLSLGAPDLNLNLGATADTAGGVCGNPGAQLGVNVDVGLSAELDAFGGFGAAKDLPNKFPLVATSVPLFSTCQAIGDSTPTVNANATTETDQASATTFSVVAATSDSEASVTTTE